MQNTNEIAPKKNQSWILIILFLIFVVPIVLAWFYYEKGDKGITHTTNRGLLIEPPRDMAQLQLKTPKGGSFDQKQLRGKWLMVYVIPTTCHAACEKNLYFMRQIRLATGKNQERVQRIALVFPHKKTDTHLTALLQTKFNGTIEVVANPKQFRKVMGNDASLAMTQGYLYLVDPLGNMMMGYKIDANPADIFKDLQKLLRVSQIG